MGHERSETGMKFELVIDKDGEECVTARVHQQTPFARRLEAFVAAEDAPDVFCGYEEDGGMVLITPSDATSVTVKGEKTYVIADGRAYLIKMRLYEAEKMLPASFVRINKSACGNRAKIARFKTSFGGGVDVEFTDGYTDYVSRRCFAQIKRRYGI